MKNKVYTTDGVRERLLIQEIAFDDGNVTGKSCFVTRFSCQNAYLYILTCKGLYKMQSDKAGSPGHEYVTACLKYSGKNRMRCVHGK
jgi:hypothetical protein